jgi:uncharacterized protein (DUF4415 family)
MRRPLADKHGEIRELAAQDMRLFRPIAEVDPGMVNAMEEFRRKLGRPKAEAPKVHIGFRLAADVVASIKASGRGYNARVEQALRAAGFGAKRERHPSMGTAKTAAAEKKRGAATKRAVSRRRGSG